MCIYIYVLYQLIQYPHYTHGLKILEDGFMIFLARQGEQWMDVRLAGELDHSSFLTGCIGMSLDPGYTVTTMSSGQQPWLKHKGLWLIQFMNIDQ